VNRPYYAFGALFTLLALATMAVSSSSRSTTVRSTSSCATCSQPVQKRPGGPAFVIVLREEGRTHAASKIAAAKVELAGPVSSLMAIHDPMDCRSYGDSAYDFAVYGALPAIQPFTPLAAEQRKELAAEELVSIFATLTPSSHPERRHSHSTFFQGWPRQLQTMALGLQNWALSRADHIPLAWLWKQLAADPGATTRPVSWDEYAELIEAAPGQQAVLRPATIRWSAAVHVQSGHWLLHSAASSLNHLALLLEMAARRLEQPAAVAANN
jgi:hypothetical protein